MDDKYDDSCWEDDWDEDDWNSEPCLDEQVEIVNKWLKEHEMEMINNTASEKTRQEWRCNIQRLYNIEEEFVKMESGED